MRYFKTTAPTSPIYAAGGLIRWATEDGDVGYYSTDNPQILGTLDKFLESRKPGNRPVGPPVEEVPEAEYKDFLGKSKGRRWSADREHIQGSGVIPAKVPLSQAGDVPAAVAEPVSVVAPTLAPEAPTPPPAPAVVTPAPVNVRRRGK